MDNDTPQQIESNVHHSVHLRTITRMKIIVVFALILVCFFAFLAYKYLNRPAYLEKINNFDTKMSVQKSGDILVTETIVYDFGYNRKRGVSRYIPLTSQSNPRLKVSVMSVEDESGQPYNYEGFVADDVFVIKTGVEDLLVSGIKTYKITYKVEDAVLKLTDYNEVYWNVTGDQWPAEIKNSTTLVVLPDRVAGDIIMNCFTGPRGSKEKNCRYQRTDTAEGTNVSYSTTKPLMLIEGFTILLDFPL